MSNSTASVDVIAVLVVDDHDLLREGVASALSSFDDIEVVGCASSGEQAVRLLEEVSVDVVLLDLVMPGMGGIAAIEHLRGQEPGLGIVALSSFSDVDRVKAAISAGANGYLTKSVDAASLARAVRSAAVGQGAFSPEVTSALTAKPRVSPEDAWMLTRRETEIANLVAEGFSNARIASELCLSLFTVKNHVSHILAKLGVQSRTEAAAAILRASQS